ncbi:MAG TPA: hypothetical protein VM532_03845 [Burkholderiales bacterium]|nr:hypothetical protein [Burkholderiales bacterium]
MAEVKAELEQLAVPVNERSLFKASEGRDRDALELLLRAGLNPNCRDEKGMDAVNGRLLRRERRNRSSTYHSWREDRCARQGWVHAVALGGAWRL